MVNLLVVCFKLAAEARSPPGFSLPLRRSDRSTNQAMFVEPVGQLLPTRRQPPANDQHFPRIRKGDGRSFPALLHRP